jgi:GDPmannose 4,6-dehydratase
MAPSSQELEPPQNPGRFRAGITVDFKGTAEGETAVVAALTPALSQGERELKIGQIVMRVNPKFYRPAEVELLIGNPAKVKAKLGWEPKTTLEQLCQMMVDADLRRNVAGFSFQ